MRKMLCDLSVAIILKKGVPPKPLLAELKRNHFWAEPPSGYDAQSLRDRLLLIDGLMARVPMLRCTEIFALLASRHDVADFGPVAGPNVWWFVSGSSERVLDDALFNRHRPTPTNHSEAS